MGTCGFVGLADLVCYDGFIRLADLVCYGAFVPFGFVCYDGLYRLLHCF